MPIYSCDKCLYSTTHKGHFKTHINKKSTYCRTEVVELNRSTFENSLAKDIESEEYPEPMDQPTLKTKDIEIQEYCEPIQQSIRQSRNTFLQPDHNKLTSQMRPTNWFA